MPEYTLKKVNVPKGSETILNANAEKGSLSLAIRCASITPSSSKPEIALTSVGAGIYSITASSIA